MRPASRASCYRAMTARERSCASRRGLLKRSRERQRPQFGTPTSSIPMRLLQRDPYLATRIRLKILSLMVMLSMALCQVTTGAEATRTGLWNLLKQAIDAGGADAADVYQLLGSIDDKTARQLLETSFAEKNGFAISSSARGLSVHQCQYYLPRLNAAALDPAVGPQPAILSAIARAGSADAAQVLMNIADKAPPSVAGVAFGPVEKRR